MPIISPIAITPFRNGTHVSQIPVSFDAEFWLTGKVTQVGETYYAISAKNGYVFPLSAAPDWDTTLNLFPYKTAVTLSAPANGTQAATTLQAIDINNFWYAVDGTANVIPFTSIFSDIDFEHKCFAENLAQTTYAETGIEKTPAGVRNIVLYNTVKATTDLTLCQTYFNVPTEVTTNVLHVSKSGNDTTGNGSKATPYLTLMKSETVSTGKTIYVKSGTYVENHYMSKAATWISTGLVRLQTTGNTYAIWNSGSTTLSINGFIIDGTTKANCLRQFATSTNKTYNKCYFVGSTTNTITNESTVNESQAIFNDCVIISTATNFCLTDSGVKFNKCFVNYIKASGSGLQLTGTATGTIDLLYSKFTGSSTYCINLYLAAVKVNYNVKYCDVNYTGNFLYEVFQKGKTITYNKAICTMSPFFVGANNNTIYVANNYCTNSGLTGYCIGVGSESTSADDDTCTNLIVENNSCLGKISIDPSDPTINAIGTHGIFVGHQKNAIIRYNRDEGCRIGLIKKHTNVADTAGGIYGNLSINSIECIYVKGQKDVKIYNNTCVNTLLTAATQGFKALRIGANGGTNYATGCDVQNNIFVNTLANKTGVGLIYADEAQSTFTSDNNTLHSVDKIAQVGASTYADLTAWKATGHDANSVATNPNLSASHVPATPISGADLGASYINGLGVLSDFGSATKLPVIVLKEQGATWQQGAYIQ